MNFETGSEQAPSDYEKIEKVFFKDIQHALGDNLAFYCVTGSLARGDVIPGWSDIDVLLFVKEYNQDVFRKLADALSGNKSGVKIGTTVYSVEEFERAETFFDPKTQHALESIRTGEYIPRHNSLGSEITKPMHYMGPLFDGVEITRILFDVKRNLTDHLITPTLDKERTLYKAIITLLKILLRREGNYRDTRPDTVIQTAKSKFGYAFDLPSIKEILANTDEPSIRERHHTYIEFIRWFERSEQAQSTLTEFAHTLQQKMS